LKNSLSQSEGGSEYRKRLCRATAHAEATGIYVREIRLIFRVRRASHWIRVTPVTLHTYLPMKMEQTVLQNIGI
jgi:hypothetical protein